MSTAAVWRTTVPLTVVAGVLRVPFWLFTLLVGIGKAARYAVFIWLVHQVA